MTRRKPSPSLQLARDVLHADRCRRDVEDCARCSSYFERSKDARTEALTLARALLRAVRP